MIGIETHLCNNVFYAVNHLDIHYDTMRGTVIENNIYFSNLLILVEDHPVVLSLPYYTVLKIIQFFMRALLM